MTDKILWGIDLGGTKIEGAVFHAHAPESALVRLRIDTQAEQGYTHIIARIAQLLELLKEKTGLIPTRVGFSTPGALDPNTLVMKNCNTTCLNGQRLNTDLEAALKVSVSLANDANCFALTEYQYGAGQNQPIVFGVIMGTGVGGGIVCNGKLIEGAHGIAGEWGHNVIEPNGPECYCGRRGCIERLMAGPRIEEYYKSTCGKTKKLSEIYQDSLNQDTIAGETLEHLMTLFARSIATVINILDPHIIVLGGGLSNLPIFYTEAMRQRIAQQIFNPSFQAKLVKNMLGDSAGVFGAGLLTLQSTQAT
jgi:predicted NBD/HSP70 family sugar kinase